MVASTRLVLALVLIGCGGDPSGTDAGIDGSVPDASTGADASLPGSDASCVGGTAVRFVDLGECFEARSCCTAADCGDDRAWRCNDEGLCEEDARTCGCVDDLDCPAGAFCFTNAVVCGICAPSRPPCTTDATCGARGRCSDGYCVDDTACMGYSAP